MKIQNWFYGFTSLVLAFVLASCSSPTPKPEIGDGGADIDENGNVIDQGDMGADGKGMGVAEGNRPDIRGGNIKWGNWEAIHFDYDSATIQERDRQVLEQIAQWAKSNPGKQIMIAGHCDERGTLEYNRALAQRRASAAREYLIKLGASANDVSTVSYGEEQPVDPSHGEDAWSQNRRDEFGIIR